mmetsp:Transcript_67306/g.170713  ORF Transcript_67306/g.170713 Transcript_67306/m.170713 type:complete len:238 (-) Transcript_67306:240-953(-)
MWQNRSPSKASGATMKPQSFFQERIMPWSVPWPRRSSGAAPASLTSAAVGRPLASIEMEKLTCMPDEGTPFRATFSLWQKRSPSNFAGHTRKPQSPFQLLNSPRSLLPTYRSRDSALALVEPCSDPHSVEAGGCRAQAGGGCEGGVGPGEGLRRALLGAEIPAPPPPFHEPDAGAAPTGFLGRSIGAEPGRKPAGAVAAVRPLLGAWARRPEAAWPWDNTWTPAAIGLPLLSCSRSN